MTVTANSELFDQLRVVCGGFQRGRVTPVLGAGASLFGRAGQGEGPTSWTGAPSATELAELLAKKFRFPADQADRSLDLLTVAQWVTSMRGGVTPLYDELHDVFDRDMGPTPLHTFFASVPGRLRERGLLRQPPMLVTTNYDDLLERAFDACEEPYDLVVYMADGEFHGQFCHQPPDGELAPIKEPQNYMGVNPDSRTVIVKLHGFVSHRDSAQDSYVITEDHYIEYLSRAQLDDLLPAFILKRLLNCHLLFLGYSLRDWNLRSILYQLRTKAKPNDWWSVRLNCDDLERKSWQKRDVTMIDISLEEYLANLSDAFEKWLVEQQ